MLLAFPPDAGELALTDEETADLAAAGEFMQRGSAYQEIQGKNPQTLGYGLTDSPAGLAGWIVEKFYAWTDHDGDLEARGHARPDPHQPHRLLGHADDQLVGAPLLRVAAHRPLRPDRRVREGADGGRGVPEGDVPHPAGLR